MQDLQFSHESNIPGKENAINILRFELDKGGQSACARQSMVCVEWRAIRNKGICLASSIRLAYSTSGFKSSWVSLPHYYIYQIALNVQCVHMCTSKINKNLILLYPINLAGKTFQTAVC